MDAGDIAKWGGIVVGGIVVLYVVLSVQSFLSV